MRETEKDVFFHDELSCRPNLDFVMTSALQSQSNRLIVKGSTFSLSLVKTEDEKERTYTDSLFVLDYISCTPFPENMSYNDAINFFFYSNPSAYFTVYSKLCERVG